MSKITDPEFEYNIKCVCGMPMTINKRSKVKLSRVGQLCPDCKQTPDVKVTTKNSKEVISVN